MAKEDVKNFVDTLTKGDATGACLLYTSPSPRDTG